MVVVVVSRRRERAQVFFRQRRPRGISIVRHRRDHAQATGRLEPLPEAAGDHHGFYGVSDAQPLHHGAVVHVLGAAHGHPVRR